MTLSLNSGFQSTDYGNSTINFGRLARSVGTNTEFNPLIEAVRIGTVEKDPLLPSVSTTLSNRNRRIIYFSQDNPIQRIYDIRTTQTPEEEFIFMRLSQNPRRHASELLERAINQNGTQGDTFSTDTDLFAAFEDVNNRNSGNVIQLPGREIPKFYNPATGQYRESAPVYTIFDSRDSTTANGRTRYFLDSGQEIKIRRTRREPQLRRRTITPEQQAEFDTIKRSIESGTSITS